MEYIKSNIFYSKRYFHLKKLILLSHVCISKIIFQHFFSISLIFLKYLTLHIMQNILTYNYNRL